MQDLPTKHAIYQFPLTSITIKSNRTGGYIKAEVIQLTKWRAYFNVDGPWRRFPGPFVNRHSPPEDKHWKWGSYVRRLRKNPWARCAAVRTNDGRIQGAVIYRRDGVSLLEANTGAVYVEYLAAAPCNRRDYALEPLYQGVGEGLMYLPILQSYDWGLGGRVALFSLPRALGFYKKMDFVETGKREDRMIHCELTPDAAVNLLESRGLI